MHETLGKFQNPCKLILTESLEELLSKPQRLKDFPKEESLQVCSKETLKEFLRELLEHESPQGFLQKVFNPW